MTDAVPTACITRCQYSDSGSRGVGIGAAAKRRCTVVNVSALRSNQATSQLSRCARTSSPTVAFAVNVTHE